MQQAVHQVDVRMSAVALWVQINVTPRASCFGEVPRYSKSKYNGKRRRILNQILSLAFFSFSFKKRFHVYFFSFFQDRYADKSKYKSKKQFVPSI
jgi:hypothetical protein